MKNPETNIPRLPAGSYLIDTHCHLDMTAYENLDEVIDASAEAGVGRIITVGIDVASSHAALAIAGRFQTVFATIGVHPHSAAAVNNETYKELAALAEKNTAKIVGYGEIGLDYVKKYAPRDTQLKEFRDQLALAVELNLPVIIHDREAHEDILHILREHPPHAAGGVLHCFSGDMAMARQVVDLGLYISIPGIVTFPRSETMQQVAREIPLDRILLETDGPFLAPVPFRGKTNKPEYLLYTAEKIAHLRKTTIAEIARQTTANAETLFKLNVQKTVH